MAEAAEKKPDYEITLSQLEVWERMNMTESHHQILAILAHGINTATEEAAMETAIQLDALCPPRNQYSDAQEYMWTMWETMIEVSRSHKVPSDTQDGVIRILQALQRIAKANIALYGLCCSDVLPSCGTMLGKFTDAEYKTHQNEGITQRVWRDLPLFAACEWIVHGAPSFLWWAQGNIGHTDAPEDDRIAYVPGGVLYEGPQTMCLRRWGFWMQRLEEFGRMEGSGLSEEARSDALKAVEIMRTVERRVGHCL